MPLGNAYPAEQLDANGNVVDSGVVIQFTDSTDQPGSGGGSTPGTPNATLLVSGPQGQSGSFAGVLTGGDSFAGTIFGTVFGLTVAGAMGQVASLTEVAFTLGGTVASTADAFDIAVAVSVSDAIGTNAASCSGGFSVAQPVSDLALSDSLTGGTWVVTAGTDLTFVGDVLSSTAGGGYFALVTVDGSWD